MTENTDEIDRIIMANPDHFLKRSQDYLNGFRNGLIFMRNLDNEMQKNDTVATDKVFAELQAKASEMPGPQITHIYHPEAEKIWQLPPPPKDE